MARKRSHKKIVAADTPEGRAVLDRTLKGLQEKDKIAKIRHELHLDGTSGLREEETRVVAWRIKPIAWAIPFDEITFSRWVINLLRIRLMPWDDFICTTSTYLPDARNTCHEDFVKNSKCEWLLMMDSDVLPPPGVDRMLLDSAKDGIKMVGGWYRKKGDPYLPCVYDFISFNEDGTANYQERKEPGTGLEKVDGSGAGIWLMHRDVAEAIGERPYDLVTGGEDLLLCRKVHDAGYDTWINWSVACAHCGVAVA